MAKFSLSLECRDSIDPFVIAGALPEVQQGLQLGSDSGTAAVTVGEKGSERRHFVGWQFREED